MHQNTFFRFTYSAYIERHYYFSLHIIAFYEYICKMYILAYIKRNCRKLKFI